MTEGLGGPSRARRRPRVGRALLLALIVVVVAAAVASRIDLNDYVLSPGDAQPVGPLITVAAGHAHRVSGSVLLTDVYVAPVTLLGYLPDVLSSNDQIVPTADLTGGDGVPASEITAQGYLEMVQAKMDAETAALRELGYSVPEHDAGAVVTAVSTGTPAYGVLRVGQVITAVGATTVANECALVRALSGYEPGQRVALSVEANHFSASGALVRGPTVHRSVRLARRPAGVPTETGCPAQRPARGFLGIVPETQQDFTLPFRIAINTADIGGPSAGLAMTLGLIDTLSGGHLTAGRTVAATGTIDASGNVGDVGGVAQKTVAVEAAGATVFFVPTPELAAARSRATPSLHLYAVNTLAQVLSVLARLGGRLPTASRKS